MQDRNKDKVYKTPLNQIADFEFNENVVSVFEDMINRSVPNYGSIIQNIAKFAQIFVQENSYCYDLGCSLGASTLAMRQVLDDKPNTKIISIDTSKDMLERAKGYLSQDKHNTPVEFQLDDIRNTNINNASFVVLNFTMQFIAPKDRTALVQKIYDGLKPKGCLILSEKVHFENPQISNIITDIHHKFKREQGYSDLEIAQKRDSLENVMKIETQQSHLSRLNEVGFDIAQQWHQHSAFCSFFAVK